MEFLFTITGLEYGNGVVPEKPLESPPKLSLYQLQVICPRKWLSSGRGVSYSSM